MKNLYLNIATKDLEVENFNLKFTSDSSEHLSQKIENRLKLVYGEFFANETIGIPYFTEVLGKNVSVDDITVIFKQELLDINEVQEIVSFVVDFDSVNRELQIEFTVIGTSGEITEGSVEI